MHPSCRIRKRNRRKRQKEGKTEMRKETSIEPITQEDSDVIKESQRVMKIKVMETRSPRRSGKTRTADWWTRKAISSKSQRMTIRPRLMKLPTPPSSKNSGVLQEDREFRCTFPDPDCNVLRCRSDPLRRHHAAESGNRYDHAAVCSKPVRRLQNRQGNDG